MCNFICHGLGLPTYDDLDQISRHLRAGPSRRRSTRVVNRKAKKAEHPGSEDDEEDEDEEADEDADSEDKEGDGEEDPQTEGRGAAGTGEDE